MPKVAPRTLKIELRVSAQNKTILQDAAKASGARSLSDFVLLSAMARAEETLPDQQRFGLDAEQWQALHAVLDAPPRPLPRLRKLFSEPSPFETPDAE
jgi:uncharacterized protein (DUF1778 family)